MPATDSRVADAVARHARLRIAFALMLLAWAAACPWGAVLGGEASRAPAQSGGMFLQSPDGATLWKQTLATVAADWPIVRIVEPDFTATPPREGLIESAWVEPPGRPSGSAWWCG
jgi:hypothetical protein